MNEAIIYLMHIVIIPAAFFAMKGMLYLLPLNRGLWRKVIFYLAHLLLTSMVIYIGDPYNLPPTLLLFMAASLLCCKGPFLQRFTIGLMVASTALSFNAFVDALSDPYSILSTLPKLFFWALFYLMMRYFAPPKDYELSPALWKLFLLLTMTPISVTCSLVLLISPFFTLSNAVRPALITCFFIAFIAFIGLFWSIIVLAKQRRLEMNSHLAEMNQHYYETMEQQQFEVRRLRHDLANHLQILASLPDGEKDAYLARLMKSPAIDGTLHYCKDSTVNAVLSTKVPIMKPQNIHLEVKADVAEELPFEKADICALLANTVDNAVEACMKLPEDQRRIELKLRAQKGVFALSAVNPAADQPLSIGADKLPNTSKADKKNHGYGLKSIHEIVNRYGGSMEIKAESGEFQLFLYMPMPDR